MLTIAFIQMVQIPMTVCHRIYRLATPTGLEKIQEFVI